MEKKSALQSENREVFSMILTDELCDRLCEAAKEKSRELGGISALLSAMKTVCREYTADTGKLWC